MNDRRPLKKIAIIGGGPAGIFCALKILDYKDKFNINPKITIFEKGKPLSTLLVTGNGRCNLSYAEFDNRELAKFYPRGEKFLYSVFSRYGVYETLEDFKKIGVKTYIQDDFRIFPETNSARFTADKMLSYLAGKVSFVNEEIKENLNGYNAIVLATGLKSGAELAHKAGHKIIPLKSALVGLKIKEKEFLKLKGVSINGVIFTDVGVSGPYIFKLSSINAYKNFPYEIKIPLLNPNELKAAVLAAPKKLFKNILSDFIPASLASILAHNIKIQGANVPHSILNSFETLNLTATGIDNKGEIVHAGGVDLNEIDKNLKSKKVENLWVIGELLNIDGLTGGFNLQNCWSTSAVAAADILEKLSNQG